MLSKAPNHHSHIGKNICWGQYNPDCYYSDNVRLHDGKTQYKIKCIDEHTYECWDGHILVETVSDRQIGFDFFEQYHERKRN